MKRIWMLFLLCFPPALLAQAPVEERLVSQKPQAHMQLKADFARQEKAKAVDRVHQAQQDAKEAQRAQAAAEKQFEAAKQRSARAQTALEKAQADLSQAEVRATQTETEAVQTWRK